MTGILEKEEDQWLEFEFEKKDNIMVMQWFEKCLLIGSMLSTLPDGPELLSELVLLVFYDILQHQSQSNFRRNTQNIK